MSIKRWVLASIPLAIVSLAAAQDHSAEGTRQLYYLATPSKETPPPLPRADGSPPSGSSRPAGALHLGLRYNVMLVGSRNQAEEVSSDHVFKPGDCFAINLQVNRSAYLYVLARQSSGSWTPLSDMPGQQEALPQGKTVRIPSGACFAVHNPPGTETLFVVLSRDPRDFYELYTSVKSKEGRSGAAAKKSDETLQDKSAKVDAAVEHLDEKFGGSRDITIAKIPEAAHSDEPRGSVYVVNTSLNLSTSLITKIEVHHR